MKFTGLDGYQQKFSILRTHHNLLPWSDLDHVAQEQEQIVKSPHNLGVIALVVQTQHGMVEFPVKQTHVLVAPQ